MTRVAVTGAGGLIGGAVVEAVRRRGGEAFPLARSGGFDVADADAVTEALRSCGPAVVVHCAYLLADRTADEPRAAVDVNVAGFLNVVEASLAAGARSFVNASSIAAASPRTAYGTMKLLNEQQLASAGFERSCSIRIANVYADRAGRGQTGWLSTALHAALSGAPASVALAPDAAMLLAWVDDVAERLAAVALSGVDWPDVADGGGEEATGAELADALRKAGAPSVDLGEERYGYPSRIPSPWLDGLVGSPPVPLVSALESMARRRAG